LVLRVVKDLQAGQATSFRFALRHGDCGQDPTPALFIEARPAPSAGPQGHMSVPTRNVTLGEGVSHPLLVNYFAESVVTQTSVSTGGENDIHVAFSTKAPLAAGSTLVLSGDCSVSFPAVSPRNGAPLALHL